MGGTTHMTIQYPAHEFFLDCVVMHRGVPVGRTRLTNTELTAGELRIEPGYEAIRDLIRAASKSLWAAGFFSAGAAAEGSQVPLDVLTRAAELELELHDETGALLWTDFVNIVERPDAAPVVFVRVRLAPGPRTAEVHPNPAQPGAA